MQQAGDRIGKYQLLAPLGSGGAGVVHSALDTVLGRKVAIKFLHPRLTHDPDMAVRFRAEAEAMARLNHPAVVTVFDFIGEANQWAIVMELVEGSDTLSAIIERARPLSAERTVRIAHQVAEGLGHAHDRGIVHRDIKASNILVVRDGSSERAKITDFGIARMLDRERRTAHDTTLGTLYYMAPEQIESSSVDPRADVYALGTTMYEALWGTVPFPHTEPAAVIAAQLTEAPVPLRARGVRVPEALDELVLRCLAKRREDRPVNGNALAGELGAALSQASQPPRRHASVPPTIAIASVELPPLGGPAPQTHLSFAPVASPRSPGTTSTTWVIIGASLFGLVLCLVTGAASCIVCTHGGRGKTAQDPEDFPTSAARATVREHVLRRQDLAP